MPSNWESVLFDFTEVYVEGGVAFYSVNPTGNTGVILNSLTLLCISSFSLSLASLENQVAYLVDNMGEYYKILFLFLISKLAHHFFSTLLLNRSLNSCYKVMVSGPLWKSRIETLLEHCWCFFRTSVLKAEIAWLVSSGPRGGLLSRLHRLLSHRAVPLCLFAHLSWNPFLSSLLGGGQEVYPCPDSLINSEPPPFDNFWHKECLFTFLSWLFK